MFFAIFLNVTIIDFWAISKHYRDTDLGCEMYDRLQILLLFYLVTHKNSTTEFEKVNRFIRSKFYGCPEWFCFDWWNLQPIVGFHSIYTGASKMTESFGIPSVWNSVWFENLRRIWFSFCSNLSEIDSIMKVWTIWYLLLPT